MVPRLNAEIVCWNPKRKLGLAKQNNTMIIMFLKQQGNLASYSEHKDSPFPLFLAQAVQVMQ